MYRDVSNSNNPTILDQDSLTGIAGEPIVDSNVNTKVTNFENRGYVLKNNGFSTDTAYDNDVSKTQTFYIDFVHGTQPITPTTPGTPGQPINPNDPNSPNTQTVLIKTV
ncbi:mucin-binding protein [Limosilactobacillus pontis]|uniref:mucin-binding protein n=1 Tax=Limosilactobacillus pontis TaxID=35787 RepID=UPI0033905701